jgi:hypothetical protein
LDNWRIPTGGIMPNFKFIETVVYDIEAKNWQDALEEFRETQPKGFTETLYCFDEDGTIIYSETDQ